ncbi:MAG: hypothetical protein ACRDO7_13585 [Nocardioidaceae bacterium]
MTGITLTRKRAMIVVAAVLVVVAIAVVILTRNTSASAGPLRHDDTLRNTTVEQTWHTQFGHGGPCLTIEFRGEISGNARPTWGITGPATVWERLRVHNTRIRVKAYELSTDGACGEPVVLESVRATLVRKTDGSWVRMPGTGSTFNKTSHGTSFDPGFAGRLDGGAYDRGESYRPMLGIYVEPHWHIKGGTASDGDTVSDAFEIPAD